MTDNTNYLPYNPKLLMMVTKTMHFIACFLFHHPQLKSIMYFVFCSCLYRNDKGNNNIHQYGKGVMARH